jgi:hypothetical protein
MVVREAFPGCASPQFKKNGHIHNSKQNHRCKQCGHQFVAHAEHRVIAQAQRSLVERLLLEKISLHGICRAVGVSIRWLMDFMVACFDAVPAHLHVRLPRHHCAVIMRCVEAEADERGSFVVRRIGWVEERG